MDERDEKKARASRRLRFAVTGALLGVASTGSGCGPSEPVMVNPAPPPEAVETSNPVAHEEAPPDETAKAALDSTLNEGSSRRWVWVFHTLHIAIA